MKNLLSAILLLCSLSIFAQAPVKRQQSTVTKPKTKTTTTSKTNRLATPSKSHVASVSYDANSNSIVFGSNQYKLVYVSGGTYTMGATPEQDMDSHFNSDKASFPAHQVTVNSFCIGATEVPGNLWKIVMGSLPTHVSDNTPVVWISWYDCQKFITKLNSLTKCQFRLPTEAEWEFAARGGKYSMGYRYSGSNDKSEVVWYPEKPYYEDYNVGTKKPNELGLYNMSGRAGEWCSDWFGVYPSNPQNNPKGPNSGTKKCVRGISMGGSGRIAERDAFDPNGEVTVSFRLAL